jgi:hypothetical protein
MLVSPLPSSIGSHCLVIRMYSYESETIKSYVYRILLWLFILFGGILIFVFTSIFKNVGIIFIASSGLLIVLETFKFPMIRKLRAELRQAENVQKFYSSVIDSLTLEFASSQSWKRRQNINLILAWVKFLHSKRTGIYNIHEPTVYNQLRDRNINSYLYQALSFPSPINLKDYFHKCFASYLFEEFRTFHIGTFNHYQDKSLNYSALEKESILPFPGDYLLNAFTMLIKWSELEPNNLDLRPAEAYEGGRALLFRLKLNE